MSRIAIAGAGVLGRLLAWRLARAGHAVTVFDPARGAAPPAPGSLVAPLVPHAAAFTAAGMLSPLAELENAGPEIATLGWRSLGLWKEWCDELVEDGAQPPLFARHGSLMVAHGSDLGAARRVLARLEQAPKLAGEMIRAQPLDRSELAALEPALTPQLHAWLLPGEGQVLPRELMAALCERASEVDWRWNCRVARVEAGLIVLADGARFECELAIDTRGVGAKADGPSRSPGDDLGLQVRGVRGEVLWLHAPGVSLHRPVRLLHPRHRVYMVPRPGDLIVVGASEIESEDRSPVSLRSAVELMAAAHSVIPELAEARIVHMESNLRPATPDNNPFVRHMPGLLQINGLFRHGWLLAPALVAEALRKGELEHIAQEVGSHG